MPKCPKCKSKIDYLKHYQSGEKVFIYDGEDYEEYDFNPDDQTLDWECPRCTEILFRDEDEARKFLKPEKKKKKVKK